MTFRRTVHLFVGGVATAALAVAAFAASAQEFTLKYGHVDTPLICVSILVNSALKLFGAWITAATCTPSVLLKKKCARQMTASNTSLQIM